jgi:hypothetical protein
MDDHWRSHDASGGTSHRHPREPDGARELGAPGRGTEPDAGARLLAQQTPQQRELAATIYRKLKEGATVTDVKDLVIKLGRTIDSDRRRGGRK